MGAGKTEVAEKPAGAHYLHGRSGLEPVLRVPVSEPKDLSWVPRKELLMVATASGDLVEVDPVMGTRTRNTLGGEPHKLALNGDGRRYAVIRTDGTWCEGAMGEPPESSGEHGFQRCVALFYQGPFLVLLGEVEGGRTVSIVKGGAVIKRLSLPPRTTVFPGSDGKIWYARSTQRGIERGRLGQNTRFSEWTATQHDLATNGTHLLGWTEYGAVVWRLDDKSTSSFGLLDLHVGAIHRDSEWVVFGTMGGVVALVDIRTRESRQAPFLTKAHDGPIRSVGFASRGRWFATSGERVQLWSWEASEAPSEK